MNIIVPTALRCQVIMASCKKELEVQKRTMKKFGWQACTPVSELRTVTHVTYAQALINEVPNSLFVLEK